ncbi:RHS repeat-associated protein [Arcticibacter tournemirensis]|uniref:DUF6443 domain-containing protein n=1 Tax=Arcticibacter tournemirensis TaxID=699437 RepID=A0A5M9H8E7_9SPHI|nr:DUF6443 domain-containing protein [Arcticibacter tournemirensis]KAA8482589.1 hypothetical protein F1649_11470 [Arcticibacter tournemirensis]TQM52559.1 RHS repeat-associated protein [Arcticibacter tournemirensis]
MNQPLRYKIQAARWMFLLLIPFLLMITSGVLAQDGTDMSQAINAGVFGDRTFHDSRDNTSDRWTTYYNTYDEYDNSEQRYGQPSPDVWYKLTVSGTTDLTVSLCGSLLDTYVHLVNENGSEIISNDDYCDGASWISYSIQEAGTYYVVVEGYNYLTGPYTLEITGSSSTITPPKGTVNAGTFGCGNNTFYDSRSNSDYNGVPYEDNYNADNNSEQRYGQPGPDVWYKLTVSGTTDLTVSLCESLMDTYVHLVDGSGSEIISNDEYCGGASYISYPGLTPGTYYVVVEGYGEQTDYYFLEITGNASGNLPEGATMYNAINAGTYSNSGNYTHTLSNADPCLGNEMGQPNNDIYYRFTLKGLATVTLSQCGSMFDTFLYLLDNSGKVIAQDNGSPGPECPGEHSWFQVDLSAGTYYVVSEGSGKATGDITTRITVNMTPQSPVIAYSFPSEVIIDRPISVNVTSSGPAAVFSRSVSTYAGTGFYGYTNSTALSSTFYTPQGVASDTSGNIYVVDEGSNTIRKIARTGIVSTLAGGGYSNNYAEGTGRAARFFQPSALVVDTIGNIIVADEGNHRIRKISPIGTTSLLAGSGEMGFADGIGSSARFKYPAGLALDTAGNLYVSDMENHRIRKITSAGEVTTFAGTGVQGSTDGAALSATFTYPAGLAFDRYGNLYVAEQRGNRIRKISHSGEVSTLAGSGTAGFANGTGKAASFNKPNAILCDNTGMLYVCDELNNMVRRISPSGVVTTFAGTTIAGIVNGTGNEVRMNAPFGICQDNQGNIYVGNRTGSVVRKIEVNPAFTISPALPEGLSLDPETGTIGGTPIATCQATTYTITARNSSGGTGSTTITFAVLNGGPKPSQDQNYILTMTPRKAFDGATDLTSKNAGEVQSTILYFDGLGRPLQTVQYVGSPGRDKDIVIPNEYDAFGREAKKYLGYADVSNTGSYKPNALTSLPSYFSAPGAGSGVSAVPSPFSETRFEPSPLNRVEEQGAPGNPWQLSTSGISGSGHTVKIEYGTNTASGDRAVRLYYANVVTTAGEGYKRTLSSTGNYEASQLYLTITKDENWTSGKAGTTEEYKDKQGQVVLKRTWKDESTPYSTYYVYDDFGDLSFVLPPGSEPDGGMDDARLNKYGYQYRYDGRRRLIEKKIPGKDGWESMVYNKIDQVVLTQDPRQAQSGKWNFSKYDGLGRVVMSGEYQNSTGTRTSLQTTADAQTDTLWERYTGGSTGEGYTNRTFPTSYSKLLSVNYYDDYTFPGSTTFGALPVARSRMIKSLLTGTKTNVLGTTTMLTSLTFYDDDGRVMQVKSQNYRGGVDSVLTTYTFTDQPETVTRYHTSPSNSVTVKTRYQYDHMGRKTHTWESINNAAEVLLAKNNYNEVGQLWKKELHNGLQTTTYTYNERGWLSGSNSTKFDLQLRYNQTTKGALPQYNGNISEQEYTGDYSGHRWFTYQYDALNRLEKSVYNNSNLLGEQLAYDKMGNITSLTRSGYGPLTYTYDGYGRLGSVSGFKAGSYVYDANGNAYSDGTRGVTITYNELNLPSLVSGTGTATYTYDAAGNKLRSVQGGTTRDYIAGIQYTNGEIDFIQTEEGRAVRKSDGSYAYEYNLKDHLGNTRVVIDDNGNNTQRVVQEDEYYAFGLNVGKYTLGNKNNYLYNGKEKQDVLTDEYDYGARFYDPVIGRWTTVDPLAENHHDFNPYNYTLSNPLRYTDPLGLDTLGINSTTQIHRGDQVEISKGQYVTASSDEITVSASGPNHSVAKQDNTKLTSNRITPSNGADGLSPTVEMLEKINTPLSIINEVDPNKFKYSNALSNAVNAYKLANSQSDLDLQTALLELAMERIINSNTITTGIQLGVAYRNSESGRIMIGTNAAQELKLNEQLYNATGNRMYQRRAEFYQKKMYEEARKILESRQNK